MLWILDAIDVLPDDAATVDESVIAFGNQHFCACEVVVKIGCASGGLFVTHATVVQRAAQIRVLADIWVVFYVVGLFHALLAGYQFQVDFAWAADGAHEVGDVVAVVARQAKLLSEG